MSLHNLSNRLFEAGDRTGVRTAIDEAVGRWLGNSQTWAILSAALIGVPIYLNGYAAIPTIGALLALGMNPGAALAWWPAR